MTFKARSGQGLMETIVALGVIMTGLIAVVSLTISNLNGEREAAIRYQAMNLAREALELVRNQRDSNWLAGRETWIGITSGPHALQFSPLTAAVSLVPVAGDNEQVNQCADSGGFAQGDASCTQATRFSRTITVVEKNCVELFPAPSTACEALIKPDPMARQIAVRVSWNQSGAPRQVILETTMYDWK